MYNNKYNKDRNNKSSSLADELDAYFNSLSDGRSGRHSKLQRAWASVVAPSVLPHTGAVFFDKRDSDVVVVYVDSSAWMVKLDMEKEFYRLAMQQELGSSVKELRFLVSRSVSLRANGSKQP